MMNKKGVGILLFIAYCLLFTVSLFSQGEDSVSHIKERIIEEKRRLEKVRGEIEAERKKLEGIRREKKDTLRKLKVLEKDLDRQRRKLFGLDSELKMLRNEMRSIKEEVATLSEDLDIKKEILEKRIIAIYKLGELDFIETIFSPGSFLDSAKRFRSMKLIALQNATLIKEIEKKRKRMLEKGNILKAEYEKIEELKNRESSLYKKGMAKKADEERVIAKLNQSERVYRKRIADLKRASSRLEKLIKELESKKRYAEEAGKRYVGAGLRGKVPWPVASREILVNFGRYTKSGVESINKGIDISCSGPVMAVSSGKVVYADWFKGYGNLVMIDHGSGFYSVYAGLSRINVGVGQKVETSALIGEVEGRLHFEIRINGEAVNPLDWLK